MNHLTINYLKSITTLLVLLFVVALAGACGGDPPDNGQGDDLEGVLLSQTAITLETGASVNGRLLAQTALELDANAVVEPAE